MINFLNLKIFSPYQIIIDKQVKKISFEDKFGVLTIFPKHQDYISSFQTHLLSYVDMNNKRNFIILSDGILVKSGRDVKFSVYSAVVGEDLKDLKEKVGGLHKRELNIKTDKEHRIEENLKDLEKYFFEDRK